MNYCVLTVPWLFHATIQGVTTGNSKHTCHINVAGVILLICIVCDGFLEEQQLPPGSGIALKIPLLDTETEILPQNLRSFKRNLDSNYT